MKRPPAPVFLIFVSFILILQFVSCIKEKKENDFITISGIDSFISPEDEKDGIKKSFNTLPGVSFSHNGHEKKNILCRECHHKKNNDSRTKKCAACHKGIQGAGVFHLYCITCHEKSKAGPVKCGGCHIEEKKKDISGKPNSDYKSEGIYADPFHPVHEKNKISCTVCHHKENEGQAKMRKCSVCHHGESRLQIMHGFCRGCHQEFKKGPSVCRGCHKK